MASQWFTVVPSSFCVGIPTSGTFLMNLKRPPAGFWWNTHTQAPVSEHIKWGASPEVLGSHSTAAPSPPPLNSHFVQSSLGLILRTHLFHEQALSEGPLKGNANVCPWIFKKLEEFSRHTRWRFSDPGSALFTLLESRWSRQSLELLKSTVWHKYSKG